MGETLIKNSKIMKLKTFAILIIFFNTLFTINNVSPNLYNLSKCNIKIEAEDKIDNLKNDYNENTDFVTQTDGFFENDEWIEKLSYIDSDNNGISDKFEEKLKSARELTISNKKQDFTFNSVPSPNDEQHNIKDQTEHNIDCQNIPIIIQFKENDYQLSAVLFKEVGGRIKSIYNSAIKGFAGIIDFDGLNQFVKKLRNEQISFLIEEDCLVEGQLYYATKNMNLRPYVWNTLGYTGDEKSAIAVIDTGIDDTHSTFNGGYGDKDFTKKIVGWHDVINEELEPYDDNGHGSHCAGIATGEGFYSLDSNGRNIATSQINIDYTHWGFTPHSGTYTLSRFNVTNQGEIEIECEFNDSTPVDETYGWALLYHKDILVDYYRGNETYWLQNITYDISNTDLGEYTLKLRVNFSDTNFDDMCWDAKFKFRGEIHWYFNPPTMGCGNYWKGVANDTRLVGVKVLDSHGGGYSSDIIDGINWVINNRKIYSITVISMSLGGASGIASVINAVNNAVENGIVTVVAAGNSGPYGNNIGSPGDADNVITVAAMSNADKVTSYSSAGGPSFTGYTNKPDIMAPGGSSSYNFSLFSADSNDNDAEGEWVDQYSNDLFPAQGTSMATPAVAGAANLVIQAMGGRPKWSFTATEAKRVKAILLMTASETYPLKREGYSSGSLSPILNRGDKDVHEGYGRINVDAALEAITKELIFSGEMKSFISSSQKNPFEKHAIACHINLMSGENYRFDLNVPSQADFDLYLYSNDPYSYGEPQLLKSSTLETLGTDEAVSFTPSISGKYYLVAKAISGSGIANITFTKENQAKPELKNEKLKPETTKYQTTLLNFSVLYQDPDDIGPTYIKLDVNGILFQMTQQNPYDLNYVDGCTFQCLIYLQPGHYNWIIKCRDGQFYESTINHNDLDIYDAGNLKAPNLRKGQVDPDEGDVGITIFEFKVNYSDLDNNAPVKINITINANTYDMIKQDILDTNYMDGCIYIFSTKINQIGRSHYYFNCSDGLFVNCDGPYSGPIVEDPSVLFREDFEGDLSQWLFIDPLWHIANETSNVKYPYHSYSHSMWFGNDSSGTYENNSKEISGFLLSNTIEIYSITNAKLEFYTWMEVGGLFDDMAYLLISNDFFNLYTIWFEYTNISSWEKITIDISDYCGQDSLLLGFYFSADDKNNDHAGWLIDDIVIYSYNPSLNGDTNGGGGDGGGGGSGGGDSEIDSIVILTIAGVISSTGAITLISIIYFKKVRPRKAKERILKILKKD